MRLLFVLPEFGPQALGGIATFYQHLVPALQARGHTVDVVVTDPHCRSAGDGVRVLAPRKSHSTVWNHLTPAPHLRNALEIAYSAWELADGGMGYDVVETTDYGMLFVPWVGSTHGPPVIVQLHGSNGQIAHHDQLEGQELYGILCQLYESSILGRADGLQSYGPRNAADWSNLLRRPVEHIWPAWRPSDTPPTGSLPEAAKPYGLVVGRIQCWKGAEVLCRAMRRLSTDGLRCLWAGAPKPFRRSEISFADYLTQTYPDVWGSRIVPIGPQPRGVIARLQANARFVAVPSTWDVFNLSAVEGMAAGRPVICSEGAGAASLIQHGENGYRFQVEDDAALADCIAQVWDAELIAETVGLAGQDTVYEALNPDTVVAERIAHYERVASLTRGPADPWTASGFAGPASTSDPYAFLDSLPLRSLARYGLRRAIRKLTW
jgi:glycosyltransferase involved in cell wall biosynthesis